MITTMIRALLLLVGVWLAGASLATPSWRFTPIEQGLPPSEFTDAFSTRQLSIGTTVNNRGHLIGYWLDEAGTYHGFNILQGTNPEYLIWNTPDFVYLSAGEPTCFLFFCSLVVPWGMRFEGDLATSAFLTTHIGSSPLPGSLPFSRLPGNFVDSNAAGVVATTQVAGDLQFGAIVDAQGAVVREDVRWLVAINDLAEPLVLGYRGEAACDVYGECIPPDECDEEGDRHSHGNGGGQGNGHTSHGNGHGYGHDPCRDKGNPHHDDDEPEIAYLPQGDDGGAVVLRFNADRSVTDFELPVQGRFGADTVALTNLFPLAMNDTELVVRADVIVEGMRYRQQLLHCRFDALQLDADLDGVLDCVDGLNLLLTPDDTLRLATVLGYSLSQSGVLAGNLGFRDSGVGVPFVLDLRAPLPQLALLANRAMGTQGWELNVVTDINATNRMIGFGFDQCSQRPDAYFLTPETVPASDLAFVPGTPALSARVAPGSVLSLAPAVTGGSGSYMFRYLRFDSGGAQWQEIQGWANQSLQMQAPDIEGQFCLRIQVADTANPDDLRERVIRYTVSEDAGGNPAQPADSTLAAEVAETLPALGSASPLWVLWAGLMLGWRRAFRRLSSGETG